MTQLSVVIPTLNEAANIDELLNRIFRITSNLNQYQFEFIFVDDDSDDGTREQIKASSSKLSVKVIHRVDNFGLASAVLAGAEAANGSILIVMDADLSHPPESIPSLVQPILSGDKDIVIGSRYVPGGCTPGWSKIRAFSSKLATLPARILTDIRDPMSGFFAVPREKLLNLNRNIPGFKIGLELFVREGSTSRIQEVPIEFQDRKKGVSKLGLTVMISYVRQLISLTSDNISLKTWLRFTIVGLSGMAVDFMIFQILFKTIASLETANIASFTCAALFNFILNKQWTFADYKGKLYNTIKKFLLFLTIAIIALLLRTEVLVLLVEQCHLPVSLSLICGIGMASIVNYLGSAFLVFS